MNRRLLILLTVLLALCLCAGAAADAEYDSYLDYGKAVAALDGSKGLDGLSARLLMRSKKPMENLDSFNPAAVVSGPGNHYTVQFLSAEDAVKCMEALKLDENVIYVQQDSLVTAYETKKGSAVSKADPYLSWGAKAMGVDELAASVTASGSVTVAVIDSGVNSHPFLNDRVKTGGVDFTDATYPDGRNDVNGHGTHVSGTIVDLTQGLNVNILPIRVLGDDGSGRNSNVCNGIRYAADAGAKIINMSLGGEIFSPYMAESEEVDAINYAVSKGVTIVVAAGNSSIDTSFFQPACFSNVIVVAAIDSGYNIASFSNYGDSVDVCAPGVNITSCSINGGYTDFNGTSMASPHVAAIAAIVKLQNPSFSPARVENYIKAHCLDLGKEGWDKVFGCGMPYFAEAGEKTDGDYRYTVNDDGAIVTAYTGSDVYATIPDTLGGVNVVGVGENAFKGNAVIESILIPGGVKEIGNFSFADCPKLRIVWFNEGPVRIGDSAFSGCAALDSVKLPDSLKNLGGEAFKGCSALKALELPSGIEAVGAYALSETGIVEFNIPASLGCVPAKVFTDCAELKTVTIEEGVKRIDNVAFDGCTALESVSIPQSLTIINSAAFRGSAIENIDLKNVKVVQMGAFLYCDKLVSVTLPDTVTTVGEWAFLGCASLKEVYVSEGVTFIESETFAECPALEKITLPRSVNEIAPDAFNGSTGVTIYGYTGSVAEETANDLKLPFVSIGYQVPLTKITPVSDEALEMTPGDIEYLEELYTYEPEEATLYELEWTSSDKSVCDVINHPYGQDEYPSLLAVAPGACTVTAASKDGSNLSFKITVVVGEAIVRSVRLDKNAVTVKIGETEKLTAKILPENANQSVMWLWDNIGVVSVDEVGVVTALSAGKATVYAVSMEDETLSDLCEVTVVSDAPVTGEFSIRAIDESSAAVTGYNGTNKEITVPETVDGRKIVMIDGKAFYKSDITSVIIPASVVTIGEKAFADCKSLTSVSLPDTLSSMAVDAFKGCKKLPKVKSIDLRLTKSEEGFIIVPVFTPENTASGYSASVSNKKSAKVSDMGVLTVLGDDYFTVTVKAGGKKAVLGVSDGEPYAASKVKIAGKAKRTLKTDRELVLTYTVKPASARVVATWKTSDPEIATVSQDGIVTPLAPGKVVITLETDIGLTDLVTITVK